MGDTNVRIVFTGSAAGAQRASDQAADSIKKIGRAGQEAAHGVDEIRERAEAGTRAINEERRAMDRLKVASLLGGAATAGKWGLMAAGIASLGAAAVGATASLAPLAGSVAVLPGLLTAAGIAFGTVKLATSGLSEAMKGNKKALQELTPAGRQFVATLQTFEPIMEKLKTTAQGGLFPGLLAGLNQLKQPAVFATINTAVGQMAKSLGGVAAEFGKVIGSQKFLSTFAVVAQAAAHWMQQFGIFAVKSFDAMISLTKAAIPLTNWMGDLSVRFATFLDNQIKAASASGKLQGFFEGVRKSITLVGHALGQVGLALFDVLRIAKPFGDALFQQIGKGAEAVRKFVESAKGKEAITGFFQSISNALSGLAPIAGVLLAGIANVLPNLLNAIGQVARGLGPTLASAVQIAVPALNGLLTVIGGLATAFGKLGSVGSAAILGTLAGIGAAKAVGGLAVLLEKVGLLTPALIAMGPAGVAAAIGVGALVGALVLISRGGSIAQREIDGVTRALQGLASTSQAAGQASRDYAQARLNVAATASAVTSTEHAYATAVSQSGRNSQAAKTALLAVRQARLSHKQAIADETSALEKNRQAQAASTQATRSAVASVERLNSKFHDLSSSYKDVTAGSARMGAAGTKANQALNAKRVAEYAAAMSNIARQAAAAARSIPGTGSAAERTARNLQLAAQAARDLALALGRIPTSKEVTIRIRELRSGNVIPGHASTSLGSPHRAAGGFIPGPSAGAPVSIIAHAGEVVLNRAQQAMLGGPRAIARMFGFTGQEGPQFAGGGFVGGWHKPKPKKAPHRGRHPRVTSTGKLAKKTLSAVEAVNLREDDLDRAYGQLTRQYEISVDAYGDNLDVAEIDSLMVERGKMLALIDEEKADLVAAINALKKAIAALVQAIRQEKMAINADIKKINLERRKKKDKHGKGGPNQKLITSLEGDVSARKTRVSLYEGNLSDLQGGLKDSNMNLGHVLPFDHRDVELDIMELQQQRVDVLKNIADAQASGDTSGGDFGGGGGGDFGGAGASDQSALVQLLMEELGKLRLALAVQGVQVPIIGSFQKGTIHVPAQGLYELHGGETVTPAGRPSVGGGSAGDVVVNIHVDPAMAFLSGHIRAEAVRATPEIASRLGRMSDARRRSGRY